LKLQVTLVTGRTIEQGTGKEHGKTSREYMESVAVCQLDSEDMKKLGVKENDRIRVTTEFGSVVVKAVKSKRAPHPKVIFIPYGPWANVITDPATSGIGMPSFKGIPAEVEPAPNEPILSLPELLKKHFRKE